MKLVNGARKMKVTRIRARAKLNSINVGLPRVVSLCLAHSLHQIKLTKVFFAHCLVISYFRLAVLLKSR